MTSEEHQYQQVNVYGCTCCFFVDVCPFQGQWQPDWLDIRSCDGNVAEVYEEEYVETETVD